jgi:purine-cytosine permease-like protein
MSDAPRDNGAPGDQPAPQWDPSGIRRSSFTPPPADAEPPTFDDDALADAMAAEVSTYTSEIKLPILPPAGAEFSALTPTASVVPGATVSSPEEDELLRTLGGTSTLEAMDLLESVFRRISNGEAPSFDLSSVRPPTETAASRPAVLEDQVSIADPVSVPQAESVAAPVDDAFAWLAETTGSRVLPAPTPVVSDQPHVVESDPDPVGGVWEPPTPEEAATGSREATPLPRMPLPGTEALGWNRPEPLPEPMPEPDLAPSSQPAVTDPALASLGSEVWALFRDPVRVGPTADRPADPTADSDVDGRVFDLDAQEPTPSSVSVVDSFPAPAAEPVAFESLFPGPARTPSVVSSAVGPQLSVAVPYSTEPPIGPESPDWLAAPPPSYRPPALVEPPAFLDTAVNPALDPVSPITANTMARLPLPTEEPKLEDRAELPPPPGYENSPRLASEPLLPVPPSAPARGAIRAIPVVVAASDGVPLITESTSLDEDDDDVVDEVDRIAGAGPIPISRSGIPEPLMPPAEPISTARLSEAEPAEAGGNPTSPSAFTVETAGLEPTAIERRTGRAARLFWLWFAANSSVVSLGLGAVLLGTGMSLRQSIVATLAGVAISFLPLGLGTLAGKWSGQPTMVVSRATFGHAGNVIPAVLAVVTRLFWGGVLLWLLATAVAQVLVGAGFDAGLGTTVWQVIGLVAGFVIATVIAVIGYGFVAKLQLVLSIVSAVLIAGVVALTAQRLDLGKALMVPDGSWLLAVGGAAIVFSVIGLAWEHSSSDIARYQRPGSSGGVSMLGATFGATLAPFVLICWGAMLAASDPALATSMRSNPLAAIASLLPLWYPAPLLAAAGLGLLSAAVLTIYSGGFAVQATGLRVRRTLSTVIAAVLVLAAAGGLLFTVSDFAVVARSLIVTIAVPVAAWAGIFAAEMMIRTRRFHTPSLLTPGGVYPQVRWLNLVALVVISVIGFGFVTSNAMGLRWEGFLMTAMGIAPGDPFGSSEIGVFLALLLGLLVPLVGGIPAIHRQEATIPDRRVHTQSASAPTGAALAAGSTTTVTV